MLRSRHLARVEALLRESRAVAILGARQTGKTTLARQVLRRRGGSALRLDLEDPRHLARLADPMLALGSVRGLVVLDEVQRRPELFPALRVLLDSPRGPRLLLLGSASPELLRQASESLAGRIALHRLPPFDLEEVGAKGLDRLWLRGGFPRSYLAGSEASSVRWRQDFVQTFLERDLPQLGLSLSATNLRRFWAMLAHAHGQIWSGADLARSMGVSEPTVRRWLDVLSGTYVVRVLPPWHENLAKRQVKSPKVYVADSGLLHTLLGIERRDDLEVHPRLGASWEGFLIEQVVARLGARPEECYFWATHAGAELDLLVVRGRRRLGFEMKRTSAPSVTPSMRTALSDLRLESISVVHGGAESFPLQERVRAVAARRLLLDVEPL